MEYKHGELKHADLLQLAAQAMCLEEMLCCEIPYGFLYYAKTHHREKIEITNDLRDQVTKDLTEMRHYFNHQYTPKVKRSKSCHACSLKDICLPKLGASPSARKYMDEMLSEES